MTLSGELDMNGVLRAEPEITRLLDDAATERLVLDLREVTFLDSTGLGLILQTDQRAREQGVALELRPGPPSVQRVFQMAGIEDALPFTP